MTKKDLTRLEDLSQILHQEDPEIDALLNQSWGQEQGEEQGDDQAPPPLPEIPNDDESSDQDHFANENVSVESFQDETNFTSENEFQTLQEESFDFESQDTNETATPFDLSDASDEEAPDHLPDLPQESLDDIHLNHEFESTTEFIEADKEKIEIPSKRENFQELHQFAENISTATLVPANPAYSVLIEKLVYKEDVEEILQILLDLKIIKETDVSVMKSCLDNGQLLIGQLSEYVAIHLTHKLRKYNLKISFGLSDEINPAKNGEQSRKPLIGRMQVQTDKKESFSTSSYQLIEQVYVSTTPFIEGHSILAHKGAIFTDRILTHEEVMSGKIEDSLSYDELLFELKQKAVSKQCNALLSVQLQLTPLMSLDQHQHYKAILSANCAEIIKN